MKELMGYTKVFCILVLCVLIGAGSAIAQEEYHTDPMMHEDPMMYEDPVMHEDPIMYEEQYEEVESFSCADDPPIGPLEYLLTNYTLEPCVQSFEDSLLLEETYVDYDIQHNYFEGCFGGDGPTYGDMIRAEFPDIAFETHNLITAGLAANGGFSYSLIPTCEFKDKKDNRFRTTYYEFKRACEEAEDAGEEVEIAQARDGCPIDMEITNVPFDHCGVGENEDDVNFDGNGGKADVSNKKPKQKLEQNIAECNKCLVEAWNAAQDAAKDAKNIATCTDYCAMDPDSKCRGGSKCVGTLTVEPHMEFKKNKDGTQEPVADNGSVICAAEPSRGQKTYWHPGEDADGDGELDPGEDADGDGELDEGEYRGLDEHPTYTREGVEETSTEKKAAQKAMRERAGGSASGFKIWPVKPKGTSSSGAASGNPQGFAIICECTCE